MAAERRGGGAEQDRRVGISADRRRQATGGEAAGDGRRATGDGRRTADGGRRTADGEAGQ